MNEREAFEEKYPVPEGVYWQEFRKYPHRPEGYRPEHGDIENYPENGRKADIQNIRYESFVDGMQAARAQGGEPVAYLTWHQGMIAVDDYAEYLEVAKTPADKSIDGTPAFPAYTHPPAPSVPVNQIKANAIKEAIDEAALYDDRAFIRVDELEAIAEKWRGE